MADLPEYLIAERKHKQDMYLTHKLITLIKKEHPVEKRDKNYDDQYREIWKHMLLGGHNKQSEIK